MTPNHTHTHNTCIYIYIYIYTHKHVHHNNSNTNTTKHTNDNNNSANDSERAPMLAPGVRSPQIIRTPASDAELHSAEAKPAEHRVAPLV